MFNAVRGSERRLSLKTETEKVCVDIMSKIISRHMSSCQKMCSSIANKTFNFSFAKDGSSKKTF